MTKKFILKFRSSLYKGLRVEGRASSLTQKIGKENQTNLSETKQTIIKANTKNNILPFTQSKARAKRIAVQRKVKSEKYVSALLTVIILAMSFCAVSASADEDIIKIGDEVSLVFNIANAENVAGVSVEAAYNSDYLLTENIVCNVGGSESNIATPGEVKWNFIVYDGMNFDNTDVVTVTFKAVKSCSFGDTEMKYNCREFFNPDLQKISDNPNSLFSVRAVHNDTEYTVNTIGSENNINSDTDKSDSGIPDIKNNVSDTDSINKTSDTDTSKITNITTDTDKTQNTYTDKSSNHNDEKSTAAVKNNSNNIIPLTTAYSQNTNDTAVDTSDSQNLTVIILLMILSFLFVVTLNKINN